MWCESFLFRLWDRYFESASTLAPILRVLIKCLGHMSEGGGGQMAEGSPNIYTNYFHFEIVCINYIKYFHFENSFYIFIETISILKIVSINL